MKDVYSEAEMIELTQGYWACLCVLNYARQLGFPHTDLAFRVRELQHKVINSRANFYVEEDTLEDVVEAGILAA
jgi:hypothetical protein